MKFANPYWSNKIRIGLLQRWIIVHSILYYELSDSIIEDRTFDANAHQLVQMQHDYPEDAEESEYWYVFYDFDANTGYHIYDRLNAHDKGYLTQIARHVSRIFKAGGPQNVVEVKSKKKKASGNGSHRRKSVRSK